ncbi:MAG: plastocyanin/azurin family copper-binding protein [Solirubrobacteraceae bacterium]
MGAAVAGGALLVALGGCSVKRAENIDLVAGKKAFVAKCGSCHVLSRAGTKGSVGPNLDEAFRNSIGVGIERNTLRGVVNQQILFPEIGGVMPAKLVGTKLAKDISAYVAFAVDKTGTDAGLLGSAVAAAGAGKPAVETAGTLEIDADPSGQLAYVTNKATAKPGSVTIKMQNKSGTPHNIAIQQGTGASGPILGASPIVPNGLAMAKVTLKAGTYTFFCQVPGHRVGGMLGTLTVK